MEIEEGFGTSISILEPVGCRGVPDARYQVLENVRHLGLGVRKNVPHFCVRQVVLKLDFRQFNFFSAGLNACSLNVLLLFREARVVAHHS
jgi:hypothetical protein